MVPAESRAANLPGTYLAWLSAATQSPATRFPTQSTDPYRLVDGTTIACNWTHLTDGSERLAASIDLRETGEDAGIPINTSTHTTVDGIAGAVGNTNCQV